MKISSAVLKLQHADTHDDANGRAFLQLFIATRACKKIIDGSTSFVSVEIQYDIWGIGTNEDKGIPSSTLIPGGNFYMSQKLYVYV
jgi:hypothetical protein